MGALQPWHIIIVVLVFLVLFGSKKLPDAARGLGRSLRIFKSEVKEMQNEGKDSDAPKDASETSDARRELPAGESAPETPRRSGDDVKRSA
ncbi:Sec-independent protein translocase subunit TatA [Gordonia soli]|uniref:Sec-independent protein translocase protein TatA n=1 Tax=Gordonia soli NBRC 108243 TaxID=1223545 RepID=M0QNY4_9ACTN|nr:Sec-independent protein translocase subunit TatA [Gordonia soli]GAC70283.1 Sec-independent protein translocase protein TatA [Gordonia soli NBRC 108243]